MASIFTYDPDPPRISSPWSSSPVSTPRPGASDDVTGAHHPLVLGGLPAPPPMMLAESGIVKLGSEPQEGPTEYKLHLLLRARRTYSMCSTGEHISGSQSQSRTRPTKSKQGSMINVDRSVPSVALSSLGIKQSRQARLHQLTTQLLWRLQQSSPYHSSSTVKLVLPALPEAAQKLRAPARPAKLIPGLEESRGALYEIGVSDDGTFVGLARDEMDESLVNLQAMAASLGCVVQVQRTVIVGKCEWSEKVKGSDSEVEHLVTAQLWVVEALVLPDTHTATHRGFIPISPLTGDNIARPCPAPGNTDVKGDDSLTEQLRVSLTGSTTSGKSSLIGTLSTSALDSGRGSSRLSLLKHRHEIKSGITSSVVTELIGYRSVASESHELITGVINYGRGNVSSWNDVHHAAEGGRLVFLTDSAGHPKYRRTTVRSLLSWAPHWTMCCVAADDDEDSSSLLGATSSTEEVLGLIGSNVDLSKAHIELCLRLDLPLIVVITKMDLASKSGLKQALAKVLSIIKAAGRNPMLLKPSMSTSPISDLGQVCPDDENEVKELLSHYEDQPDSVVPIVLTSAVTGAGISKLHALLHNLPIPKPRLAAHGDDAHAGRPGAVFHIDELYTKTDDHRSIAATDVRTTSLPILSGHVRHGSISLGDTALIGPLAPEPPSAHSAEMYRARSYPSRLSGSPLPRPGSYDPRRRSGDFANVHLSSADASSNAPSPNGFTPNDQQPPHTTRDFLLVRIISIRNLRLPLRTLLADQVGTIGISPLIAGASTTAATAHVMPPKLRKGMVLVRYEGSNVSGTSMAAACAAFKALFSGDDYRVMEPGGTFAVFVASVRAPAKVVSVEAVNGGGGSSDSVETLFELEADAGSTNERAKGEQRARMRWSGSRSRSSC